MTLGELLQGNGNFWKSFFPSFRTTIGRLRSYTSDTRPMFRQP
jgi:hypothetical protein